MNKEELKLNDKELHKCINELKGTQFLSAFCILDWIIKMRNENEELKERINKIIDYIESNPLVMIGDYDYFVNDILQMEEYCSRMSFIRTLLKILKGED